MVAQPRLAIILVNWNGWHNTSECLNSLRDASYSNKVIMVVDNGSSDGAVEAIKRDYPEVHLIELNSNTGFCEANNVGIEHALNENFDYIMLLNNDTTVDSAFIEPQIAALQSGYSVVSGLIYYSAERKKIWFAGSKIDWHSGWPHHTPTNMEDVGQFQGIIEPDYITGCSLTAAADTWKQVGMLDTKYFAYFEDADWSVRASRLGYRLGVVTQAKLWHKVSASATPKWAGSFLFVRNGLLFICKQSKVNRFPVYLRFINQWVLRPSLREAKRGEFSWNITRARISGIIAHFTGQYGTPFKRSH